MPPAMDDALYDPFHSDQMIFGPIDLDDPPQQHFPWDDDVKPAFSFGGLTHYEFAPAYDDLNSWINDPDLASSPIAVPLPIGHILLVLCPLRPPVHPRLLRRPPPPPAVSLPAHL